MKIERIRDKIEVYMNLLIDNEIEQEKFCNEQLMPVERNNERRRIKEIEK